MSKAVLGTHLGAGLAPDAIQWIVNAHHHGGFIGEAIFFVVQPIIGVQAFTTFTLHQLEDVSRTRLVTTTTADTALLI
jgi:hypothetical protein